MVAELSALPKSFPTTHWTAIHLDIRRLLDRAVRWQVNHGGSQSVAEVVAQYKPQIALVRAHLGDYVRGADQTRLGSLLIKAEEWGLPSGLGHRWTQLFEAFALLDVVKIAAQSGEQLGDVASVYYTVYDRFGVDNLLERITALPRTDRWQALARAALRDDLYSTVADITTAVLEATDAGSAEHRLLAWEELNAEKLARSRSVFEEVNALGQDDMASLSVAMRLLRSIVRR
jgi:glutamate dehydrogenase